jgi:hypothetical protein
MSNLGQALPGTSLAICSYASPSNLSIRFVTLFIILYLHQNRKLRTLTTCSGLTSKPRTFHSSRMHMTTVKVSIQVPFQFRTQFIRALLAVCFFNASNSGVSLRVYYSSQNNVLLKRGFDNSGPWYARGFN